MTSWRRTIGAIVALCLTSCGARPVLNEFTSDGCSLFPDGNLQNRALWCECCFVHDAAYWRGGTEQERLRADEQLRACVQQKAGDAALAQTMFLGVRAGGAPVFPTWYRWGYGWSYGRGYQPLSADEALLAQTLLARSTVTATKFCAARGEAPRGDHN